MLVTWTKRPWRHRSAEWHRSYRARCRIYPGCQCQPLAAGADLVGMEDPADQIAEGEMNFDVNSPDARAVGQLAQILGPRGLHYAEPEGQVL